MTEAEICAATGISHRMFIRRRQQGLVQTVSPRRGLGPGRGTTPLEYSPTAIETLQRFNELHREIKDIEECRWRLWCENHTVRVAPDLAMVLSGYQASTKEIKTFEDIKSKLIPLLKPAYMPRGNPLRIIFRDISEDELQSVAIILASFVLGIRLPLFDEPNPHAFRVFKRAFGLPSECQLPPWLPDVFPDLYEQSRNALLTATNGELEMARAVYLQLSRILDNPEKWRRGAIEIAGGALPWRPIKLLGLMWPCPLIRALTVALPILLLRALKSRSKEVGVAFVAAMAAFPQAKS